MPTRYYRPTVIACALTWFLVGLHTPLLHQLTHHDRSPGALVLTLVALFVVLAVAALWTLLRVQAPPANG